MDMQLKNRLALISAAPRASATPLPRPSLEKGPVSSSTAATRNRWRRLDADSIAHWIRCPRFAGDLSTADTADALVRAHPDIEVLVNNLGIFEPKPFEQIADADWMRFFEVNVLSGIRLARLCLPA